MSPSDPLTDGAGTRMPLPPTGVLRQAALAFLVSRRLIDPIDPIARPPDDDTDRAAYGRLVDALRAWLSDVDADDRRDPALRRVSGARLEALTRALMHAAGYYGGDGGPVAPAYQRLCLMALLEPPWADQGMCGKALAEMAQSRADAGRPAADLPEAWRARVAADTGVAPATAEWLANVQVAFYAPLYARPDLPVALVAGSLEWAEVLAGIDIAVGLGIEHAELRHAELLALAPALEQAVARDGLSAECYALQLRAACLYARAQAAWATVPDAQTDGITDAAAAAASDIAPMEAWEIFAMARALRDVRQRWVGIGARLNEPPPQRAALASAALRERGLDPERREDAPVPMCAFAGVAGASGCTTKKPLLEIYLNEPGAARFASRGLPDIDADFEDAFDAWLARQRAAFDDYVKLVIDTQFDAPTGAALLTGAATLYRLAVVPCGWGGVSHVPVGPRYSDSAVAVETRQGDRARWFLFARTPEAGIVVHAFDSGEALRAFVSECDAAAGLKIFPSMGGKGINKVQARLALWHPPGPPDDAPLCAASQVSRFFAHPLQSVRDAARDSTTDEKVRAAFRTFILGLIPFHDCIASARDGAVAGAQFACSADLLGLMPVFSAIAATVKTGARVGVAAARAAAWQTIRGFSRRCTLLGITVRVHAAARDGAAILQAARPLLRTALGQTGKALLPALDPGVQLGWFLLRRADAAFVAGVRAALRKIAPASAALGRGPFALADVAHLPQTTGSAPPVTGAPVAAAWPAVRMHDARGRLLRVAIDPSSGLPYGPFLRDAGAPHMPDAAAANDGAPAAGVASAADAPALSQVLWRYPAFDAPLPASVLPDARGVLTYEENRLIRVDHRYFHVRFDRDYGTWRVFSPREPQRPGLPVRYDRAAAVWSVTNEPVLLGGSPVWWEKWRREARLDDDMRAWAQEQGIPPSDRQAVLAILQLARQGRVRGLNLDGYGLTALPPGLDTLPDVTSIDASHNRLAEVALPAMPALSELKMAGNGMRKLTLGEMPKLTYLHLAENALSISGFAPATLPSLTELFLSGNQLGAFPESVLDCPHLRVLSMERNGMTRLPEDIWRLGKLEQLFLRENELTALPDRMGELPHLRRLDLASNRIRRIPETFGQLGALRTLNLSGNALTELPDSLGDIGALLSIDLSDNLLEELPAVLDRFSSLVTVDLTGNPLSAAAIARLDAHPRQFAAEIMYSREPEEIHLARAVRRWLDPDDPDTDAIVALHQSALAERGASDLARLLNRLHMQDGAEGLIEQSLRARLKPVLALLGEDAEFRARAFAVAEAAGASCTDHAALAINDIEIAYELAKLRLDGRDDLASRLALARRCFRQHELDRHTRAAIARRRREGQNVDEVEVLLRARIDLATTLRLLAPPPHMLFAKTGRLPDGEIDAIARSVLEAESSPALVDGLLSLTFWRDTLEARHAQAFAALQRRFDDRMTALDAEAETLADADYLARADALQKAYASALTELRRQLTRDVIRHASRRTTSVQDWATLQGALGADLKRDPGLTDPALDPATLVTGHLAGRGITDAPAFLDRYVRLQTLDMSSNALDRAAIPTMPALRELRLDNNGLTTLTLGGQPKLKTLTLGGNALKHIETGPLPVLNSMNIGWADLAVAGSLALAAPRLEQLRVLGRTHADGAELRAIAEDVASLRRIVLQKAGLRTVPAALLRMTSLHAVGLGGNGIAELPAAIGALPELRTLELTGNRLELLPATLADAPLSALLLGSNRLKKWPAVLEKLPRLMKLDLSGNQLTEVGKRLADLPLLSDIDLSNNRLTELDAAFDALPARCRVDLRGNPLSEKTRARLRARVRAKDAPTILFDDMDANASSA
jgi:Leucine-rich repeat (LRR) protein